jgi:three-Cys-motif partner protein
MAGRRSGKVKPLDVERLKEKLSNLIEVGKVISKVCPQVHYEARKWTPLKLVVLMCYVDMYSKIMSKRKGQFAQIIYIDPLAGSGTNLIKDTNDIVAGSVPISIIFSGRLFHKYFFAEADYERRVALQARLARLEMRDYEIMEDCNQLLSRVASYLGQLKRRAHYLMFVDSEGLEVKWSSLSDVLPHPGDLIFVFQTREVMEQKARWKGEKALTNFYGNEDWKNVEDERGFVELYKEQIKTVETIDGRSREVASLSIKSDEKERYCYDIIFAAPKTKGGNPWFWKLLSYLEQKVTKYTGDAVKNALDILAGRSSQIDWFLPVSPLPTLNDYVGRRRGD